MADVLLVDVADRVATLTMNRPEARNALNRSLRSAISRTVVEMEGRDDVDVLVLTGADPAFSAGVDLKETAQTGFGGADDEIMNRGPMPPRTKPLIGAINGVAITGGFEVALACDFLVASENARFADTHSRVGVMPGWGLTVLLPQAIGVRRAREMSTTGNFVDAETALIWGLVNHVVTHGELLPFCHELASDIVSNDQAGVRRMLQTYHEGSLVTAGDAWDIEARVSRDWLKLGAGSPDEIARRREAVIARGRSQQG